MVWDFYEYNVRRFFEWKNLDIDCTLGALITNQKRQNKKTMYLSYKFEFAIFMMHKNFYFFT